MKVYELMEKLQRAPAGAEVMMTRYGGKECPVLYRIECVEDRDDDNIDVHTSIQISEVEL